VDVTSRDLTRESIKWPVSCRVAASIIRARQAALDKAPAIAALKKPFGIGEELIQRFSQPYLYLNYDVRRASGLDRTGVEPAVAEELRKFVGWRRLKSVARDITRPGSTISGSSRPRQRPATHCRRSWGIDLQINRP
jgi:hypothetical protein